MKKDISNVVSAEFGDYACLYGGILRENAYVEWLQYCIKRIE